MIPREAPSAAFKQFDTFTSNSYTMQQGKAS